MIQQQLFKIHDNIVGNIKTAKNLNKSVTNLYDSLLYYFEEPGKMLRPRLMLSVASDLNIDLTIASEFATSLEMIHNYSLIHDDLPSMDNDDFRRGRLTVHRKFNESTAILAGDFLLNESFNYILKSEILDSLDSRLVLKSLGYIAEKANDFGMIGGQIMDLDQSVINTRDDLIKMYEFKTSALFQCSFAIPAIIKNLIEIKRNDFEEVGRLFGIIFQILDDIDDQEQDKIEDKITIFSFENRDSIDNYLESLKSKLGEKLLSLELSNTRNLIIDYLGEI